MTIPTAKEVIFPLVLQPISIATETQFRRDQAGVTEDVELVHPSEAAVLEQVIQAIGVRIDAKLRRVCHAPNLVIRVVRGLGKLIQFCY